MTGIVQLDYAVWRATELCAGVFPRLVNFRYRINQFAAPKNRYEQIGICGPVGNFPVRA